MSNGVYTTEEEFSTRTHNAHVEERRFNLRRQFLKLLALPYLLSFYGGAAFCDTITPGVDGHAIKVLNPTGVRLIAITEAGSRLVAVGEQGVIIHSDDDGQSWTQASVPVSVSLTTVGFATPMTGWAAGAGGIVVHTTDGGNTWEKQLDGLQVNQLVMTSAQYLAKVSPASPQADRAMRRANLFIQAGPDKPFLAILAVSAKRAIVFGAYRLAVVTSDGGSLWTDISLQIGDPLSHNIYGLTTLGSDIYLAAETGLVFRSTDAGQTFLQVSQAANATLFGILSANDGSLIAYGVAGTLARSTDLGATWTTIKLGISSSITAGRRLNSGEIIIVSQSGNIFLSEDNGVSFSQSAYDVGEAVSDFIQASDGHFVFVGDNGILIVSLTSLTKLVKRS